MAFLSPIADALLVGGLSIIVFIAFGFSKLWTTNLQVAQVALWASALSWVINYPHFSATVWRLYARRETRQEFKWTTWWSPVVAFAGLALCYVDPTALAPLWAKFFILWSGYHFSAQSLGFTMLYLRRDRFEITQGERMALGLLLFAPYFGSTLSNETAQIGAPYFSLTFPTLGLPLFFQTLSRVFVYTALVVGVVALVRAIDRRDRWPHFLVFVPIVSQWIWFWFGRNTPEFNYFVPGFHSLQYLAIAAYMRGAELQSEDVQQSAKPKVSWPGRTAFWYAINVAGGATLFWGIPQSLARIGEWWAPGSVYGREDWVIPVVFASVQVHHFFVDGVIWKLRHASVRESLMRPTRLLAPRMGKIVSWIAIGLFLSFSMPELARAKSSASENNTSQMLIEAEAEHRRQKLSSERVLLRTDFGDVILSFYPEVAPQHVERMLNLARQKAWVGKEFPRLVPGFVLQIQELSPDEAKGSSSVPLLPLREETSKLKHIRGVLSMARKTEDRHSAMTSWSVLLGTAPHLDGDYTIFGRIDRGSRALSLIEAIASPINASQPIYRIFVRDVQVLQSGRNGETLLPDDFVEARFPDDLSHKIRSILTSQQSVSSGSRHHLQWSIIILLVAFILALLSFNPPFDRATAEAKWGTRFVGLRRYLHGVSILFMGFAIATLVFGVSRLGGLTSGLVGVLSLVGIWLSFKSVSGFEVSQADSKGNRESFANDSGAKSLEQMPKG